MGCAASTNSQEAVADQPDPAAKSERQQRPTTDSPSTTAASRQSPTDGPSNTPPAGRSPPPASSSLAPPPRDKERAVAAKRHGSIPDVPEQGGDGTHSDEEAEATLLARNQDSMDHYRAATFGIQDDDEYYKNARDITSKPGSPSPLASSLKPHTNISTQSGCTSPRSAAGGGASLAGGGNDVMSVSSSGLPKRVNFADDASRDSPGLPEGSGRQGSNAMLCESVSIFAADEEMRMPLASVPSAHQRTPTAE